MTSGPGGAFAPRPRRAESAAGARRAAAEAAAGEEGDPGRRRGDAGVWRIFLVVFNMGKKRWKKKNNTCNLEYLYFAKFASNY